MMQTQRLISIFMFLFLGSIPIGSHAQDRYLLALDKPGIVNRKRFHIDDKIWVKTYQEKHWNYGEIDLIQPDFIVLEQRMIPLRDISHLRVKRLDWLHYRLQRVALGGVMFFTFFSVNSLANNDHPILRRGEWLAPLGLVTPFIVLQPFRKRSYKIGEKRVLKVIVIL
ncbi:MAG: hypothetical protein ACK4GL_02230 [Flavobacteriales bacterium]